MTERGVVVLCLTRPEHRRLLALVRTQALIERTTDWEEAVELLETDRPPARNVVPLASRRASLDEGELLVRAMNAVRPSHSWADDRREKVTDDEHSFGL